MRSIPCHDPVPARPNQRMQLPGDSILRNVGSPAVEESPQLIRGPLSRLALRAGTEVHNQLRR
jgi:hypothetical protein